ncbi:MAG: hypothetical protein KF860_13180 [Cyclobacteriaceae bacterium]|nr:hypothetical protein [Cyclobacteriaceae bacterium]
MRLAQLARKIGIKPGEIVTFLADKNLPIEGSSNAKVTEDQLERILTHFAPELLLSHIADEAQEMSGEKIGSSPDLENAEITLDVPLVAYKVSEEIISVEESKAQEVIKPILVELPGLKVIGKIDLPEPKKKEVENLENKEEIIGEKSPTKAKKGKPHGGRDERRRQEREPRKNVIALQREREAREALQRKQQEKERKKELRTQRYIKKVSKYTPPPQRPRKNKNVEEYEVYSVEQEKPKSFIGKILGWFYSE